MLLSLLLLSLIADADSWLVITSAQQISVPACKPSEQIVEVKGEDGEDCMTPSCAAERVAKELAVEWKDKWQCYLSPGDFCFSPGHCDDRLIELFGKAEKSIDVAIYSLNRATIVDALLAARAHGVAVRVLVDNLQSKGAKEKAAIRRLDKAAIEHHRQHHAGIMHMKVAVVDRRWVVHGSTNWTNPAVEKNDEVLSVIDCPAVAEAFSAEYAKRWAAAAEAEAR